ncbi:hypothetical protein PanWU01x14_321930 [Parasponia andersonii]|uniref:Transmembrane protein n=1 Tax=Parasponia andersonii TaxID=3476 RepID=A0A2P5AL02_PARAD|nr:hypothetical protein PanWU01x14_321930 [Parasponia andersonii]
MEKKEKEKEKTVMGENGSEEEEDPEFEGEPEEEEDLEFEVLEIRACLDSTVMKLNSSNNANYGAFFVLVVGVGAHIL